MIIRNETRGGNEKGGVSVQLAFILRSRQLSQALRTGVFFTALVGLGFMVAYLRVEFFSCGVERTMGEESKRAVRTTESKGKVVMRNYAELKGINDELNTY